MASFFNVLCGTKKAIAAPREILESDQWIETQSDAERMLSEFVPSAVSVHEGATFIPHDEVAESIFKRLSENSHQLGSLWATNLQEQFEERRDRQDRKQEESLNDARKLYQRSKDKEYQEYVRQQEMRNAEYADSIIPEEEAQDSSACSSTREAGSSAPKEETATQVETQGVRQSTLLIVPEPLSNTPRSRSFRKESSTGPRSLRQFALFLEPESDCGSSISPATCEDDGGADPYFVSSEAVVEDHGGVERERKDEREEDAFDEEASITDPAEVRRLQEAMKTYTSRVSRQQKEAKKEATKILNSLSPDQYGQVVEMNQIVSGIDMDFIRWASGISVRNGDRMPTAHEIRRAKEELFDATPLELRGFIEYYPYKQVLPLLHAVE